MTKVLCVTGAKGFIGRHVARAFASHGWQVMGIGHGSWEESSLWGLSSWQEADVNLQSLRKLPRKPEVVIHCAGGGSVALAQEAPEKEFEKTVASAEQVLEYVRVDSKNTKFIYASSAAVYGNAKVQPISESQDLLPISPYGQFRKNVEELIALHGKKYGTKAAIVRFFSVYGAGLKKQLLWDACKKLSQGESRFFGTGKERRDWLHVQDACSLFACAVEHADSSCPVVNGGTGSGTSTEQVLSLVVENLKSKQAISFSGSNRTGDPQDYIADITKAKSWGWQPSIPLDQGIFEYVKWYKEQ